jgi:hypothetical protein
MNPSLNGYRLLGPTVTARQIDGWRKIVKDERALVRHIILNQNTMRLTKIIPLWSNFRTMHYYRTMQQFLDGAMLRKYQAWWELIFIVGDTDRQANKQSLMFAWTFLVAEVMHRKHGRVRSVDAGKFGLKPEREAELKEAVLSRYESLTLS